MFLAFELELTLVASPADSYVPPRLEQRRCRLERGWNEDPGVFAEIVFGIEIPGEGNAGRRTTGDEQGFGELAVPLVSASPPSIQACYRDREGPESQRGIEEARRGEIQRTDIELGGERSPRSVGLIDRPTEPSS